MMMIMMMSNSPQAAEHLGDDDDDAVELTSSWRTSPARNPYLSVTLLTMLPSKRAGEGPARWER